jgi:hypothetical protein
MESKKTFLVGLVLALAVVWLGVSTTSLGAEALFGAWGWVDCGTPCNDIILQNCYNGPGFYCQPEPVWICNVVPWYQATATCSHTSDWPCDPGYWLCDYAERSGCGGVQYP